MRQSCRWVGEISPPLHLHSKQSLLCIKYSLWQRQHRNHTLAVTLTCLVNLYRGAIGQLVQQSDKIGLKIWRRQNLYVETEKKCHMVICSFNLSGSVNFILTHQDTSNNSQNCQITASTPLDTLIEDTTS